MPYCWRHPDRETFVSCGRCERPLCPDCVRHGATGVRCADCLKLHPRARGAASGAQILRGAAAALSVGLMGGLLLGWLHWVNVMTGFVLGFGVGSTAFVASQRHRDPTLQGLAGIMALLGVLVAAIIVSYGDINPGPGAFAQAIIVISYQQLLLPAIAGIAGAIIRFLL